MVVVDTSIFIALERLRRRWEDIVSAGSLGEEPRIAAITVSEMLMGAYRADTSQRRIDREARLEAVVSAIPVLEFGVAAARLHASIGFELASAGRTIGANDLIIASVALANDTAVLTFNVNEFRRVPGLDVRSPDW